MRHLVSLSLLLVALVHALPLAGVLGVQRLQGLYGVAIDDPNLQILMRHRAVLFGLLAGFLGASAFKPELQPWGIAAGLVSVGSFLVLARLVGQANAELGRVVAVDLVALGLLVASGLVLLLRRGA